MEVVCERNLAMLNSSVSVYMSQDILSSTMCLKVMCVVFFFRSFLFFDNQHVQTDLLKAMPY